MTDYSRYEFKTEEENGIQKHDITVTFPLFMIYSAVMVLVYNILMDFSPTLATLIGWPGALLGLGVFVGLTKKRQLSALSWFIVALPLSWVAWSQTNHIGWPFIILLSSYLAHRFVTRQDKKSELEEEIETLYEMIEEPIQTVPAPTNGVSHTADLKDAIGLDDIEGFDDELFETEEEEESPAYDFPVMPHLLFYGPPGTGKSTLAKCLVSDLKATYGQISRSVGFDPPQTGFTIVTPSQLTEKKQLDELVTRIQHGDVILIDEVHGLSQVIEEALYSVLQDGEYFLTENGTHKRIEVPRACFIGCTTLAGDVNQALRSRMIEIELEPLSEAQIMDIQRKKYSGDSYEPTSMKEYNGQNGARMLIAAHLCALKAGITKPMVVGMDDGAAKVIAERSLGNPRMAKLLQRHAEAWAVAKSEGKQCTINPKHVEEVCKYIGIDHMGLTPADRRVVKTLLSKKGRPVGKSTLSSSAGVSVTDLESIIEPKLLVQGIIEISARGRLLTEKGVEMYGKGEE